MSDRTMEYQAIEGGSIHEEWAGREVPVPPKWVIEHNRLPRRYRYAVLAKVTSDAYPRALYEAATQYLARWPVTVFDGRGALFSGDSGAGKTHTAAAIVNETVRHFGHTASLPVEWLPAAWRLQDLLDYRHFGRSDEYYAMRNRLRDCSLLVVDDLLYAAQSSPVKEFLFGLYDYRYQKKLPIVTTMNAELTPEDWSAVESVFNGAFRRRLQESAAEFTVIL